MNDSKKDLADFGFLSNDLAEGSIVYVDDDHFLFEKIINAFPITAHRIDWDLIPHDVQHVSDSYPENKLAIERYVNNIVADRKIGTAENVWLCFDGITKGAMRMPLEVLIDNAGEIFTIPQHTYVLPENVSWCINYTFENVLYFGYSPG